MAGSRLNLQTLLEEILGSEQVHFQAPESGKMTYPAIVYALAGIDNTHANNDVYMQSKSYEITVIDYDPDSEIVNKVSKLPKCRFNRHFKSDNLNHYVFTIYY